MRNSVMDKLKLTHLLDIQEETLHKQLDMLELEKLWASDINVGVTRVWTVIKETEQDEVT